MAWPFRFYKPILVALMLLLVVVLARALWLPWIGEALVHDDGPGKAGVAVVLAGDDAGKRIEQAARMVQQGFVPAVLVDGPEGPYGTRECDLAIAYIVGEGYPREWFIPLPMRAHSTAEEARIVIDELERRHTGSFLLITSDYHSGRAGRTFRKALRQRGDRIAMRVVATPDDYFHPASWWRDREGRKMTLLEWIKTVAAVLGI